MGVFLSVHLSCTLLWKGGRVREHGERSWSTRKEKKQALEKGEGGPFIVADRLEQAVLYVQYKNDIKMANASQTSRAFWVEVAAGANCFHRLVLSPLPVFASGQHGPQLVITTLSQPSQLAS